MVNLKSRKSGQAAIEFLMTYGWMLLVVLIVGALVFSFVDFGSLLPNKVDISTQSVKGDAANSAAYSNTFATAGDRNLVYVAFTYSGGQKATIDSADISLTTNLGDNCDATNVSNDRLGSTGGDGTAIQFLSGHPGLVTFDCDHAGPNAVGTLLSQDVLEGTVSIGVKDSTRGTSARAIPNTGAFRLSIE